MDEDRTKVCVTTARDIAMRNGVRYAYTGNVPDRDGGTTRCHECHTPLIVREGYVLRGWELGPQGLCSVCGARCAGVFSTQPGTWGPRRLPVRLTGWAS